MGGGDVAMSTLRKAVEVSVLVVPLRSAGNAELIAAQASDGKPVLLAFTDTVALKAWATGDVEWAAMKATDLAALALEQNAAGVWLNIKGPHGGFLDVNDLKELSPHMVYGGGPVQLHLPRDANKLRVAQSVDPELVGVLQEIVARREDIEAVYALEADSPSPHLVLGLVIAEGHSATSAIEVVGAALREKGPAGQFFDLLPLSTELAGWASRSTEAVAARRTGGSADELWQDFVAKENRLYAARVKLFASGADLGQVIDQALPEPGERATALRLLLIVDESLRRSFLPALIDLGSESPRDVHLVQELVRSMDEAWLISQLPRIVEYVIAKDEPGGEDERRRVLDFLRLLDPRLADAFLGWSPPRQFPGANTSEVSAVLKLALESLREQPTGFAQRAIDAALGWSKLLIPTTRTGEGDPVVTSRETDRRTVVAFTDERQLAAWGAHQGLVWRSDPAMRTVWRALAVAFDGILLDPDEQNAGVLLPRAGLRAVAGGRPLEEIEAGDNYALRIAAEALRTRPAELGREALRESVIHGGLLVPVAAREEGGTGESYVFRSAPELPAGERVLYAFSDRLALKEAPSWVGDTAAVVRGPSAIQAAERQGYAALLLNAGLSEGLTVSLEDLPKPTDL